MVGKVFSVFMKISMIFVVFETARRLNGCLTRENSNFEKRSFLTILEKGSGDLGDKNHLVSPFHSHSSVLITASGLLG